MQLKHCGKIHFNAFQIRKYCLLFTVILIINTFSSNANDLPDSIKSKRITFFSGYFQYGKVLPTNPYLRLAISPDDKSIQFTAFSFQLLKQTTGENLWEEDFGYPCYGIGIYSASFFENQDFGTPVALYGVFKAPFKRWSRLSFNYESGFGLTFNWNAFNPSKNDYNPSMGAKESVFIDLGVNVNYELTRDFDLGIGYSFTHFSNGALKNPNMGLNTFSPKIVIAYRPKRFIPQFVKTLKPTFDQKTTLDLSFFGGIKNVIYKGNDVDTVTKYKGVYYPVFGFITVLNRQINSKSKIGVGTSLCYDGSDNSTILVEKGRLEPEEGFHLNRFALSIFPSYELVINKLSVVVQPGFYVHRKLSINRKPLTYQRLGIHYRLGEKLFAGIVLHAYSYHISDFIEWTLGYRLNLLKKAIK